MLAHDIRFALRTLLQNKGFAAVAILSLALGIGANSAIFSLADALLLRPLPITNPGRVAALEVRIPDEPFAEAFSYPDYLVYRDQAKSFQGVVALKIGTFGFRPRSEDIAQMRVGVNVSANFFDVLGVTPALGRGFRAEENEVPGRDAVIVLSHGLWQKEFASDPGVLGRKVQLQGQDFTVIGVAPESFTGIDQYLRPAFYLPLMMRPSAREDAVSRKERPFVLKARLVPGVSYAQADAEVKVIAQQLARQYPDTNRRIGATVMTDREARESRSPYDAAMVKALLGLVALVLVIACANVANLLLSRAKAREREIAVRLAIGAGRLTLVRQLLIESLMLALAGGVAGLAVAYGGIRFLQQIQVPTDLPIVISPELDGRVLLYALVASVVSALIFGLIPAWQSTRADLVPALKASASDSTGRRSRLLGRNALVVAQVALSLALVVAASLLFRAFGKLLEEGPGFRSSGLMMMSFDPTLMRYSKEQTRDFYRALIERVRQLPGVRSATLTYSIPFGTQHSGVNVVPEDWTPPKGQETVSMLSNTVDEDYFRVMQIPIVSGRAFQVTDQANTPKVAIVNEHFAAKFWPGKNAVGKRIKRRGEWIEVVGVARNSKYLFIAENDQTFVYLPLRQNEQEQMAILAESAGDPASLAGPMRNAVRSIDAGMPVYNVRTMDNFFELRAVAVPNMILQTVGSMGFMGLTLALVGLYGLVAYNVARRTREIGIRMAIGASRADVVRLILRQGLVLGGVGVAIGWAASFGTRQIVTAGFGDLGWDPLVFIVVPLLLFAITMAAAFIPAWRASRIEPTRALRYE